MQHPRDVARAWPAPSAEAVAYTRPLLSLIQEEIRANDGHIPFSRYMELALYTPGLGYYGGELRKFGAEGDFVTAPELSPLFSHCVARQCAELLEWIGGGDLLEAGAGSGAMAAGILAELARREQLPNRYFILELSASLRQRQGETLQAQVPTIADRVTWLAQLPERGFRGVVLANELLDAMPVHRVQAQRSGFAEYYVGWEEERFVWRRGAPSNAKLRDTLQCLRNELREAWAEGYVAEVGLAQPAWIRSIGELIAAGALVIIDYGFPRRELYHPERHQGTLMCHYRHRAHSDPLILTGLQDITAHVDFTAVAEAGMEAGLDVKGYTTQADFLLGNGLTAELAAQGAGASPGYLSRANEVKRLVMPGEMGELFKVMALTRAVDGPLQGFTRQDRRGRL
ncbi:MAG: SAM-dependent methyltransferase [Gammaproteobacteria bacterium]|nr:SAM-dependent methyltransferase [Gammaproteobacteria bacterium]